MLESGFYSSFVLKAVEFKERAFSSIRESGVFESARDLLCLIRGNFIWYRTMAPDKTKPLVDRGIEKIDYALATGSKVMAHYHTAKRVYRTCYPKIPTLPALDPHFLPKLKDMLIERFDELQELNPTFFNGLKGEFSRYFGDFEKVFPLSSFSFPQVVKEKMIENLLVSLANDGLSHVPEYFLKQLTAEKLDDSFKAGGALKTVLVRFGKKLGLECLDQVSLDAFDAILSHLPLKMQMFFNSCGVTINPFQQMDLKIDLHDDQFDLELRFSDPSESERSFLSEEKVFKPLYCFKNISRDRLDGRFYQFIERVKDSPETNLTVPTDSIIRFFESHFDQAVERRDVVESTRCDFYALNPVLSLWKQRVQEQVFEQDPILTEQGFFLIEFYHLIEMFRSINLKKADEDVVVKLLNFIDRFEQNAKFLDEDTPIISLTKDAFDYREIKATLNDMRWHIRSARKAPTPPVKEAMVSPEWIPEKREVSQESRIPPLLMRTIISIFDAMEWDEALLSAVSQSLQIVCGKSSERVVEELKKEYEIYREKGGIPLAESPLDQATPLDKMLALGIGLFSHFLALQCISMMTGYLAGTDLLGFLFETVVSENFCIASLGTYLLGLIPTYYHALYFRLVRNFMLSLLPYAVYIGLHVSLHMERLGLYVMMQKASDWLAHYRLGYYPNQFLEFVLKYSLTQEKINTLQRAFEHLERCISRTAPLLINPEDEVAELKSDEKTSVDLIHEFKLVSIAKEELTLALDGVRVAALAPPEIDLGEREGEELRDEMTLSYSLLPRLGFAKEPLFAPEFKAWGISNEGIDAHLDRHQKVILQHSLFTEEQREKYIGLIEAFKNQRAREWSESEFKELQTMPDLFQEWVIQRRAFKIDYTSIKSTLVGLIPDLDTKLFDVFVGLKEKSYPTHHEKTKSIPRIPLQSRSKQRSKLEVKPRPLNPARPTSASPPTLSGGRSSTSDRSEIRESHSVAAAPSMSRVRPVEPAPPRIIEEPARPTSASPSTLSGGRSSTSDRPEIRESHSVAAAASMSRARPVDPAPPRIIGAPARPTSASPPTLSGGRSSTSDRPEIRESHSVAAAASMSRVRPVDPAPPRIIGAPARPISASPQTLSGDEASISDASEIRESPLIAAVPLVAGRADLGLEGSLQGKSFEEWNSYLFEASLDFVTKEIRLDEFLVAAKQHHTIWDRTTILCYFNHTLSLNLFFSAVMKHLDSKRASYLQDVIDSQVLTMPLFTEKGDLDPIWTEFASDPKVAKSILEGIRSSLRWDVSLRSALLEVLFLHIAAIAKIPDLKYFDPIYRRHYFADATTWHLTQKERLISVQLKKYDGYDALFDALYSLDSGKPEHSHCYTTKESHHRYYKKLHNQLLLKNRVEFRQDDRTPYRNLAKMADLNPGEKFRRLMGLLQDGHKNKSLDHIAESGGLRYYSVDASIDEIIDEISIDEGLHALEIMNAYLNLEKENIFKLRHKISFEIFLLSERVKMRLMARFPSEKEVIARQAFTRHEYLTQLDTIRTEHNHKDCLIFYCLAHITPFLMDQKLDAEMADEALIACALTQFILLTTPYRKVIDEKHPPHLRIGLIEKPHLARPIAKHYLAAQNIDTLLLARGEWSAKEWPILRADVLEEGKINEVDLRKLLGKRLTRKANKATLSPEEIFLNQTEMTYPTAFSKTEDELVEGLVRDAFYWEDSLSKETPLIRFSPELDCYVDLTTEKVFKVIDAQLYEFIKVSEDVVYFSSVGDWAESKSLALYQKEHLKVQTDWLKYSGELNDFLKTTHLMNGELFLPYTKRTDHLTPLKWFATDVECFTKATSPTESLDKIVLLRDTTEFTFTVKNGKAYFDENPSLFLSVNQHEPLCENYGDFLCLEDEKKDRYVLIQFHSFPIRLATHWVSSKLPSLFSSHLTRLMQKRIPQHSTDLTSARIVKINSRGFEVASLDFYGALHLAIRAYNQNRKEDFYAYIKRVKQLHSIEGIDEKSRLLLGQFILSNSSIFSGDEDIPIFLSLIKTYLEKSDLSGHYGQSFLDVFILIYGLTQYDKYVKNGVIDHLLFTEQEELELIERAVDLLPKFLDAGSYPEILREGIQSIIEFFLGDEALVRFNALIQRHDSAQVSSFKDSLGAFRRKLIYMRRQKATIPIDLDALDAKPIIQSCFAGVKDQATKIFLKPQKALSSQLKTTFVKAVGQRLLRGGVDLATKTLAPHLTTKMLNQPLLIRDVEVSPRAMTRATIQRYFVSYLTLASFNSSKEIDFISKEEQALFDKKRAQLKEVLDDSSTYPLSSDTALFHLLKELYLHSSSRDKTGDEFFNFKGGLRKYLYREATREIRLIVPISRKATPVEKKRIDFILQAHKGFNIRRVKLKGKENILIESEKLSKKESELLIAYPNQVIVDLLKSREVDFKERVLHCLDRSAKEAGLLVRSPLFHRGVLATAGTLIAMKYALNPVKIEGVCDQLESTLSTQFKAVATALKEQVKQMEQVMTPVKQWIALTKIKAAETRLSQFELSDKVLREDLPLDFFKVLDEQDALCRSALLDIMEGVCEMRSKPRPRKSYEALTLHRVKSEPMNESVEAYLSQVEKEGDELEYHLKEGSSTQDLIQPLKALHTGCSQQMNEIKTAIQELIFLKTKKKIEFDLLKTCFMDHDFKRLNHLIGLSQDDSFAQHAIRKLYFYFLLESYQKQTEIALDQLNKGGASLQEIASKLLSKRNYSFAMPMKKGLDRDRLIRSFLVFESTTGAILRSKQIDQTLCVATESLHSKRVCGQYIMGMGKTFFFDVWNLFKSWQKGTIPILVIPDSLIESTKRFLAGQYFSVFNRLIHYIEVNRSTCSASHLRSILRIQKRALESGEALLVGRETIPSLIALLKSHLYEQMEGDRSLDTDTKVSLLREILHLFKQHGHMTGDEAHQLFERKVELNFPVGELTMLSPNTYLILEQIMQGYFEIFHKTGQDVRTFEHTLISKSEEEYHESIKGFLSHYVADISILKIDPSHRLEVIEYVSGHSKTIPEYVTLHPQREGICFARGVITKLLPHALSINAYVDWGPSQVSRAAIPYSGSNSPEEGSTFKMTELTALLTYFKYYSTGLSLQEEAEIRSHFEAYIKQEEKDFEIPEEASGVIQLLQKSLKTERNRLDQYTIDELRYNFNVISYYVSTIASQDIRFAPHSISSDAQNFASAFAQFDVVTGTPDNAATYPLGTKLVKDDTVMGQTVLHLQSKLKSETSSILCLDEPSESKDPVAVLIESTLSFKNAFAIMDAGALFQADSHLSNLEAAQRIMDYCVLHRPEIDVVAFYDADKQLKVLQKQGRRVMAFDADSTPPHKRITLYDQAHTVGSDISQDKEAIGILTINGETTWSSFAQALWRLRGFGQDQNVVIALTPSVQKSLKKLGLEVNLNGLISHLLLQQEEELKEDCFYSDLAKLRNLRTEAAELVLYQARSNSEALDIFKKHRDLFVSQVSLNAFENFGQIEVDSNPKLLIEEEKIRTIEIIASDTDLSDLQKTQADLKIGLMKSHEYPSTVKTKRRDLSERVKIKLSEKLRSTQSEKLQVSEKEDIKEELIDLKHQVRPPGAKWALPEGTISDESWMKVIPIAGSSVDYLSSLCFLDGKIPTYSFKELIENCGDSKVASISLEIPKGMYASGNLIPYVSKLQFPIALTHDVVSGITMPLRTYGLPYWSKPAFHLIIHFKTDEDGSYHFKTVGIDQFDFDEWKRKMDRGELTGEGIAIYDLDTEAFIYGEKDSTRSKAVASLPEFKKHLTLWHIFNCNKRVIKEREKEMKAFMEESSVDLKVWKQAYKELKKHRSYSKNQTVLDRITGDDPASRFSFMLAPMVKLS
ncbi:MAG: DUF3638 domain-containing protein [Simkaniaceae bacterium]|nr:DUF3638 domain-containing protein [Simkaniaceae bacterium]